MPPWAAHLADTPTQECMVLGEGVFILWFSLDLAKAGPVDFCVVKEKSFYNFWSFIKKLYI